MTKRFFLLSAALLFVVIVSFAALSDRWSRLNVPVNDSRIKVAATIFPLADIARNVGGKDINVVLIIPPGVTEHSSSLSPQLLRDLQNTKAIYRIGHGLDDDLTEKISADVRGAEVVTVDANIKLLEFGEREEQAAEHEEEDEDHEHDTGSDPHYWLAVPNAITIAENIASSLQTMDPEHADSYQRNLEEYRRQLTGLEQELQHLADGAGQKNFIAIHNAWSYFAKQYGFNLAATFEPREGQEPSATDIQRLQEIIGLHDITTFYAEPQKQRAAAVQFIHEALGLQIRILDPVGGFEGRDNYINLMRANMAAIAR